MVARRPYTTGYAQVDRRIAELLESFGDGFDRELLAEMVTSIYRFGRDGASTIDLKIVNSAVKELRYAFKVFQPYRRIRKVAIFGSARTPRGDPSYEMAREFGRIMARSRWMVITGAASGIMKAGHEGAGREASFGLNIRLPFEQEANPVIARDRKLVSCKYFFTRKLLFIKESDATVLFPGGFGTLDEGFECLTLVQTGKSVPRPIVFVDYPDGRFWGPLLKFFDDVCREEKISSSDRSLYTVARSAREAAAQVKGFYRVYHSMRYVGEETVFRLQKPMPDRVVRDLSRQFGDILISGRIRQGEALSEEEESQRDEPELQKLPRLIFRFNRRDYGRLVELIHRINAGG